MWRVLYVTMIALCWHYPRMALWVVLQKLHIVDKLCDEGYHKLSLLAFANEIYRMPCDGGGINSLIKWQLLYWHSAIPAIGCDRVAVRDYVKSKVGYDVLVPMLPNDTTVWDDPNKVDFSLLPERFVLKCTNGGGMLIIVLDKSKLNIDKARKTMQKWITEKPASHYREFQYGLVKNRIICEQFIGGADGKSPFDYKIMCSNGKPLFAWIDFNRFDGHTRLFVDTNFNILDCYTSFVPKLKKPTSQIKKPKSWTQMLEVASKLSKGIPIVRVDLYDVCGKIYFGELTFSPGGGLERIFPFSCSQKWARQADISSFTGDDNWIKS